VVLGVTMLFSALGVVVVFLVNTGTGSNAHVQFLAPHTIERLRRLVGAGFTGGGVWMAAIIGVLCVTGEYRHKVITTTLLTSPKRPRLLTAKALSSVVWGIGLAISSLVVVAAFGIPLLVTQGGSSSALLHQVGPVIWGLLGAFALLALFGVGFGCLLKNQVAAVLTVLAIAFIVEPIIDAALPSAGRWLPSAASAAVAGHITGRNSSLNLLSWWLGVIVLAVWSLGAAVLGYYVTFRRDVT
jgi:ABC-2 type transport system permease protein